MEKKINRVQRWLERCLKAFRSGYYDNALADMECAWAELESARKELWSEADGSRAVQPSRAFSKFTAAVFAASVFVLFGALPLAVSDQTGKALSQMPPEDDEPLIELVTRDEKALLSSLRKSLSSANSGVAELPEPRTAPEGRSSRPRKMKDPEDEASSIKLDEMIELMEIGQRALRGDQGFVVLHDLPK